MNKDKAQMTYDDYFNKAFHSDEVWTQEDNDKFNDLICDRDNELAYEYFAIDEEIEADSGMYSDEVHEKWMKLKSTHMNNVSNFYEDVSRYLDAAWHTVKMEPGIGEFGVTQDTINFINGAGAFRKHFEEYVERCGDTPSLVSDVYKNLKEVNDKKSARKIPSEFQDITDKAEQMNFSEEEGYDIV